MSKLTKSISNLPSISAKDCRKGLQPCFRCRKIRCYGRICPRRIQRRRLHNRSYTRFFIDVGVVFDKCSELIVTDTMRERKGIMEDKADAFVICAGGMGTFEEFFEVLTLKQLNRHTKPIIIYNVKATITQCLQCLTMP